MPYRNQSASTFQSERVAFDVFKAADYAKPFKILPIGTFYRDDRTLTIDDQRAQEIVNNFNGGLPRYQVQVNIEHGEEPSQPGSVGVIKKLRYVPGDGVYADEAEFTEVGKQLLDEERYKGVSPEIVWALNNGAMYQDPQTGQWLDNVLVGLALTTAPFFGKAVQTFSAKQSAKRTVTTNIKALYDQLVASVDGFKVALGIEALADKGAVIEKPETFDTPDVNDVHIGGSSMAKTHDQMVPHHGSNGQPDAQMCSAALKEEDLSAEEKQHLNEHLDGLKEKGTMDVNVEEFTALKAQAAEVETLKAKVAAGEVERKAFAEQFAAEQRLRKLVEFRERAETFSALPAKRDELAEQMLWLQEADKSEKSEHFAYFEGLLKATNEGMAQSHLFTSIGSEQGAEGHGESDPFMAKVEEIRVKRFADKPYAEGFSAAHKAASSENPKLAYQYVMEQRMAGERGGR